MASKVEILDQMIGLGEQELCLFDRRGNIIYCSAPFKEFLSRVKEMNEQPEKFTTLRWLSKVLGLRDSQNYVQTLDEIWKGERIHHKFEYVFDERFVSLSFTAAVPEKGEKVEAIALHMQDITAEIQKKSDFLMSTLASHSPQPVALISHKGEILRVNPAFSDLCGVDLEHLEGLNITSIVDLTIDEMEGVEKGQSVAFYDKHLLLSKKHRFPVEAVVGSYKLQWASAPLYYVMLTDLRLWQEKEAMKRRMLILTRQRDISADLHDNVAQSLALLQMNFEQLLPKLGESIPPEGVRAVVQWRKDLDEVQVQMRDMIRYLREESSVRQEDCLWGMEEVLRYGAQVLKLEIVDMGLAVISMMNENTQREVAQLVREALTNVYKHADTHIVWLTSVQDGDNLIVKVSDKGCGFDEAEVDKKEHYGLSILKERTEGLGGELYISSIKGEGTDITFVIPFYRDF